MSTKHRLMLVTADEESMKPAAPATRPRPPRALAPNPSGIIDTKELLGDGTFLFDAQVRKAHPDLDRGGRVRPAAPAQGDRLGRRYQEGQSTR